MADVGPGRAQAVAEADTPSITPAGEAEVPASRMVRLSVRLWSSHKLRDAAVGLVIGILSWPVAETVPSIGIDSSWIVALHLAAREHLQFGRDIVFTFGPLGFLGFPEPYLGWTSALSLVFVGAVHVAACIGIFHLAGQAMGRRRALPLVFCMAFMFPWITGWALFGVLIFLASVAAVLRRVDQPSGVWFAVIIGAAVGLAGLGKLNVGMVSATVGGLAVVGSARHWQRSLAAFLLSAALVLVGLWLALSQDLLALPGYVRGAIEISAGYSESMGMVDPNSNWVSAVAVLATVILATMIWQRTSHVPRRDRLMVWLLFSVMVFASFKGGFTRASLGMAIFLSVLLALWPVVSKRTSSWIEAYLPVLGMTAAFLAVLAMPATGLVDPSDRVASLHSEVRTVLLARSSAAASTAASLRSQYNLPQEAIDLLVGKTVDIEPWESAVAYAYPEIKWRPQPVFQAYSAYTEYLDQLNAGFLAGDNAPDRILWLSPKGSPQSIDWRNFWFDSPAAKVQMLCRYVPLASTPTWQVLGRVAERCGTPVAVGTVTARAGEPVKLPANLAPGIVTVRVSGVGKDPLSRLVTLVYETPPWYLREDQSLGRLSPGTAGGQLVLGANTDVGYLDALALPMPPNTVTVGPAPGDVGYGSPLTYEFQVIPLRPPS